MQAQPQVITVETPAAFFKLPQEITPPSITKRGREETHFIFNAGFWDISLIRENWQHVGDNGILRRGSIIPVFRAPYWDDDSNPTRTPGAVYDEIGRILRYHEPGDIVQALERQYSGAGLIVLWDIYGSQNVPAMMAVANLLNFREESNRDGLYLDKMNHDNPALQKKLQALLDRCRAGNFEFSYVDILKNVLETLVSRINAIQVIFRGTMSEIRAGITEGKKPALDNRDRAMCNVAGFALADYEVNADASKIAVQSAISGIGEGIANAIQSVSAVAQNSSSGAVNSKMLELLEAQQVLIEKNAQIMAEMRAELDALKASSAEVNSLESLEASSWTGELPKPEEVPTMAPGEVAKPKTSPTSNNLQKKGK